METNQDGSEVHETTEEVAAETTQEISAEQEELSPEQIADLKKKADASSQNYERLKKADAELKELRAKLKDTGAPVSQSQALSNKDVLYLAKSDVHEDDIDEVLEWAKFKNISVADAHKSLKPALEIKAEQRKTAEAANISAVRRGPTKASEETLLDNARAGKLPDTEAEIERLIRAKQKAK
jgi:hypothetical protein